MEDEFYHCLICLVELSRRHARWSSLNTGGRCLDCKKRPKAQGRQRCSRCLRVRREAEQRRRAELSFEARCWDCLGELNDLDSERCANRKAKLCQACREVRTRKYQAYLERRRQGLTPVRQALAFRPRAPKHGPQKVERGRWVTSKEYFRLAGYRRDIPSDIRRIYYTAGKMAAYPAI